MDTDTVVLRIKKSRLLTDKEGVLFDIHMELAKHEMEMKNKIKNQMLRAGAFRGTVVGFGRSSITARDERGVEKTFQLTPARARQLLDDTTTL